MKAFDLETYTGQRFLIESFDYWLVDIEDIAQGLSMQCRYNGQCMRFYSVAEHSVLVAKWFDQQGYGQRLQLLGLMHDAAEAYVGDLILPVKRLIPAFKVIENSVERAIWKAFDIEPPNRDEARRVKEADCILLASEAAGLMSSGGKGWELQEDADGAIVFQGLSPDKARRAFLDKFTVLGRKR